MTIHPKELDRRMGRFFETCQQTGLRITPQRTEIFRDVASTDEHPSAEAIHGRICEKMPHVSLDTVYRTLNSLADAGLILELQAVRGCVHFDANMSQHGHFICTSCGMIRDFSSGALDRFEVPAEVRDWGQTSSFHLEVRGTCARCLKKPRNQSAQ